MMNRILRALPLALTVLVLNLNSCGKMVDAESNSDENKCGFKFVNGRDCIVCSKGGVSCRWD